jgi:hypothetical protein
VPITVARGKKSPECTFALGFFVIQLDSATWRGFTNGADCDQKPQTSEAIALAALLSKEEVMLASTATNGLSTASDHHIIKNKAIVSERLTTTFQNLTAGA